MERLLSVSSQRISNGVERGELLQIEEDLTSTRKVARAGVTTREELARSLYPLLPIIHVPESSPEDATTALRARLISRLDEAWVHALIDQRDPSALVNAILAERHS